MLSTIGSKNSPFNEKFDFVLKIIPFRRIKIKHREHFTAKFYRVLSSNFLDKNDRWKGTREYQQRPLATDLPMRQ